MSISEVVAIGAVILSVGTNVALCVHSSSTMNSRFDSGESRLQMLLGHTYNLDVRVSKMEARS